MCFLFVKLMISSLKQKLLFLLKGVMEDECDQIRST